MQGTKKPTLFPKPHRRFAGCVPQWLLIPFHGGLPKAKDAAFQPVLESMKGTRRPLRGNYL
jgi:hypothetical protein